MSNSSKPKDGLPTGEGTSSTRDVSDPHPANEERYDRQKRPGGAHPPKRDLGPNDATHDGTPAPRLTTQKSERGDNGEGDHRSADEPTSEPAGQKR